MAHRHRVGAVPRGEALGHVHVHLELVEPDAPAHVEAVGQGGGPHGVGQHHVEGHVVLDRPAADLHVHEQDGLLAGEHHGRIQLDALERQGGTEVHELLALAAHGHAVHLEPGQHPVAAQLVAARVARRHLEEGGGLVHADHGRLLRALDHEVGDLVAGAVERLGHHLHAVAVHLAFDVVLDLDLHALAGLGGQVRRALDPRPDQHIEQPHVDGGAGLGQARLLAAPLLVRLPVVFLALGGGAGLLLLAALGVGRGALLVLLGALVLDPAALLVGQPGGLPRGELLGAVVLPVGGQIRDLDLTRFTPEQDPDVHGRGLARVVQRPPAVLPLQLVRPQRGLEAAPPAHKVVLVDQNLVPGVVLVLGHEPQGPVQGVLREALDGARIPGVHLPGPALRGLLDQPAGHRALQRLEPVAADPAVQVTQVERRLPASLEERQLALLHRGGEELGRRADVQVSGLELHEQGRVEVDERVDLGELVALLVLGVDPQGGDAVAGRMLDLAGLPGPVLHGLPAQELEELPGLRGRPTGAVASGRQRVLDGLAALLGPRQRPVRGEVVPAGQALHGAHALVHLVA